MATRAFPALLLVAALAVVATEPVAAEGSVAEPVARAPGVLAARDEAGLRAADREHVRTLVERDVEGHRELVHANFLQSGPARQVWRKRQATERLRRGDEDLDHFERTIEGLTITRDVGVVTGTELVSAADRGGTAGARARELVERRYTNVYLHANGRWWLLARQATPVASFAPAAPKPKLEVASSR